MSDLTKSDGQADLESVLHRADDYLEKLGGDNRDRVVHNRTVINTGGAANDHINPEDSGDCTHKHTHSHTHTFTLCYPNEVTSCVEPDYGYARLSCAPSIFSRLLHLLSGRLQHQLYTISHRTCIVNTFCSCFSFS